MPHALPSYTCRHWQCHSEQRGKHTVRSRFSSCFDGMMHHASVGLLLITMAEWRNDGMAWEADGGCCAIQRVFWHGYAAALISTGTSGLGMRQCSIEAVLDKPARIDSTKLACYAHVCHGPCCHDSAKGAVPKQYLAHVANPQALYDRLQKRHMLQSNSITVPALAKPAHRPSGSHLVRGHLPHSNSVNLNVSKFFVPVCKRDVTSYVICRIVSCRFAAHRHPATCHPCYVSFHTQSCLVPV